MIAVGALVVAAAVGGLVRVDDPQEPVELLDQQPTERADNPPADTLPRQESVALDVAALDVAVPIRVLALRNTSLAIVDLFTGESTTYPPGAHGLPRDAIDGATLLSDGTVVVWQQGTVRAFPQGLGNPPVVHTPAELVNPSWAAPAVQVMPTADERALWVVQSGSCCPDDIPGLAELIDLDTGAVVATAELPANSFPVATTARGLVLNTHRFTDTGDGWQSEKGSHHTLLITDGGMVTRFASGAALATSSGAVALLTCQDHERRHDCLLDLVDIDTGGRQRVHAPADGEWTGLNGPDVPASVAPWSATAPDGRILVGLTPRGQRRGGDLVRQDGDDSKLPEAQLIAIEPATATASTLHRFDGWPLPAAWDQRGEHIVLSDGPHLTVLDTGGSSVTLHDVIPAQHDVVGMR